MLHTMAEEARSDIHDVSSTCAMHLFTEIRSLIFEGGCGSFLCAVTPHDTGLFQTPRIPFHESFDWPRSVCARAKAGVVHDSVCSLHGDLQGFPAKLSACLLSVWVPLTSE